MIVIGNIQRHPLCLQFWDEDIANLAQMWSNQCVWEHGFVEFGDEYPHAVNFKRVGTIVYLLTTLV